MLAVARLFVHMTQAAFPFYFFLCKWPHLLSSTDVKMLAHKLNLEPNKKRLSTLRNLFDF